MNFELIAKVCHNVNKAYCDSIGDTTQVKWENAEQWQKDSAIAGVKYKVDNINVTPAEQHKAWCDFKVSDGWVYGDVKDADKKTHPCLVDYNDLPMEQKVKDYLFVAVVESMI